MTTGPEILQDIIQGRRATEREAMSYAAVASFVDGSNRLKLDAKRHNAQVDAYLKAKFKECDMEDAYTPPSETGDDVSHTLINCHFNGDEAVTKITNAIQELGTDGDSNDSPPEKKEPEKEPQVVILPPPPPPPKKNWLSKVAGPLLGVGLGGAIAVGAASLLAPEIDPNQYDMIALPYQPQEAPNE